MNNILSEQREKPPRKFGIHSIGTRLFSAVMVATLIGFQGYFPIFDNFLTFTFWTLHFSQPTLPLHYSYLFLPDQCLAFSRSIEPLTMMSFMGIPSAYLLL